MSAISSVEVESFRCFKKLRVDGLTPINIVVGSNNAGKTALLEAIEAVVSEGSPFALYRASMERGEFRRRRSPDDEERVELDVRHWFYRHQLEAGAEFQIRAKGQRDLAVSRSIEQASPFGFRLAAERLSERAPLPLTEDGWLGAGVP